MDLLRELRAFDRQAWARFVREHAAKVYRWSVFLGLSASEAEDAAQEVFAICARRIDRCDDLRALPSWLYQITRRVAANVRRRTWFGRVVLSNEHHLSDAAFDHPTDLDRRREIEVRRCLDELPSSQREVVVLMDIEGYTREEVATMLNIAPGTVASRRRLGHEAFRRHWREEPIGLAEVKLWTR